MSDFRNVLLYISKHLGNTWRSIPEALMDQTEWVCGISAAFHRMGALAVLYRAHYYLWLR